MDPCEDQSLVAISLAADDESQSCELSLVTREPFVQFLEHEDHHFSPATQTPVTGQEL